MSKDVVKITTYISLENKEKWREACYLLDTTKKAVINEALELGLDIILEKLKKENKKSE